jgi:hypothetical protein
MTSPCFGTVGYPNEICLHSRLARRSTVVLGNASDGNISDFIVWFKDGGSANYSIVTKGRAFGFDVAQPNGVDSLAPADNANIAYQPVATRTLTDPGTTPLVVTTGPAGIIVPADGMTVSLVCTRTAGALEIYWAPLNG